MTALPDLTPEVRDAIARLCGGRIGIYNHDIWEFGFEEDHLNCLCVETDRWLAKVGPHSEAIQESILLRGLVRAGVLGHANAPHFFAAIGGEKGLWKDGPQTPIAALVALAAAHIEANKTKEPTA